MRKDLEDRLGNIFSFMKDIYIEAGDGWFELIYSLCKDIQNIYSKYNLQSDITVDYIKQKNGELVFMAHYDADCNVANRTYQTEIDNIISEYENQSIMICEECGKNGWLRDIDGWFTVLCNCCFENNSEL